MSNAGRCRRNSSASCKQPVRMHFGVAIRRAHPVKAERGHGFISSQREGSDLFAHIDPRCTGDRAADRLAVFAPSCRQPGASSRPDPVAGELRWHLARACRHVCMAGTLTSLGRYCARLWSENFDDPFFLHGLREWLEPAASSTIRATCIPSDRRAFGDGNARRSASVVRLANMCCVTRRSSACSTRSAWA